MKRRQAELDKYDVAILSALSVNTRLTTVQLAEKGMGIIVISDEIPEVLQNCNRVLVMRKGRIIKEFKTEQTNEEELNELIMMAEQTA